MGNVQLELERLTKDYLAAVFKLQEHCSDEVYDKLEQFTDKIVDMLIDIDIDC